MAFRSQTRALAILIGAVALHAAELPVKHAHFPRTGDGTLAVSENGIAFTEPKKMGHARAWVWEKIQQLTVERGKITLLTYEDAPRLLWRDRQFVFTGFPPDAAGEMLPLLRMHLGTRLISAMGDLGGGEDLRLAAKWITGRKGPQGTLRLFANGIAFDTETPGAARAWTLDDIELLSRPGGDELTVTVRERSGLRRLPLREYRFQLQEPLPEERYQALWRTMNQLRIGPPPAVAPGAPMMHEKR